MPDWKQLVSERLRRMKLPPEEREEVVEELAVHFHESYEELRDAGSPDPEGIALAQVPDWNALGRMIQKSKEALMNQSVRMLLSGIVTGAVAFLLAVTGLLFLAGDFFGAVEAARRPSSFPEWSGWLLNLAAGIWTMWLYRGIRSSYGRGWKTAAAAGIALWVIGALSAAIWSSMGLIPLDVLFIALAIGLPAWVTGAVAGASLYEATEKKPSQAVAAT